jgi:hypothetical protein
MRRVVFVAGEAVRAQRRRWGAGLLLAAMIAASSTALLFVPHDDRVLAAPICALAIVGAGFVLTLWARDGVLPVFEVGTLCMLANVAYGGLALAGFYLMHGQWHRFADGRLQAYPFIPDELGMFGWRYVVYAASFAAVYLLIRGRSTVKTTAFIPPRPNTETAIVIMLVLLFAAKIALRVVFGYGEDGPDVYANLAEIAAKWYATPLFLRQIGHNVISALAVVKLATVLLLLAHWRRRWCRYALYLWVVFELVGTAVRFGSRGEAVLLLLSVGMLFHRLVRRLSFFTLGAAGVMIMAGFLLIGALREFRVTNPTERPPNVLIADNEFQALFTTAFDLYKRKQAGELDVPWQIYVSDFYYPIPSQFLPFQKIDPGAWYLDVLGLAASGVGFMFGVMAQASVGVDWIELLLRGAALAAFLAYLHRWYVRRSLYFWPTLFYVFVAIWTYYSVRASSFYFLYFIVYHFLPVMLSAKILSGIFSRVRRGAGAQPEAVPA